MDAASQALALQQKIMALGQEEQQLEIRQLQLRSQLTSYEKQLQEARATQRANLERLAQQRAQGVRSQLESVDKRLVEVRAEKEQLFQQQDAFSVQQVVQAHERELAAHRSQERAVLGAQGTPPRLPKRKRRWLVVTGLVVLGVVVVLAVVLPVLRPHAADQVSVPTIKDCVKYLAEICYGPTQVQNAYQLTSLYRKGYDGRGQTIVIVGTGNPTTLKSDLHKFDVAWGLADPPSFQIVAAGVALSRSARILSLNSSPKMLWMSNGHTQWLPAPTLCWCWRQAMLRVDCVILAIWTAPLSMRLIPIWATSSR